MGWSVGVCIEVILLVSCGLQCLVYGAKELREDTSYLHCGATNMQFSLPLVRNISALSVVDKEIGDLHLLNNNTVCGTWVLQKPEGLVIGAAYDGCYISQQDGYHVMTVLVQNNHEGKVHHQKKELKCPVMPAMDAPNPSECAAIKREDRLSCANSPVSRDLCERLGCCFSPSDSAMPCYFGNKVTAQCTADNLAVVALSKELTSPSLVLDSVRVSNVNPTSCQGYSVYRTKAFIMFQFPLSCGGMKQVDDGVILYENTIEATKDIRTWEGNSITRDSTMKLTLRCRYVTTGIVPLVKVEVFTLPPPPPVSTSGPLLLEMRIARDLQYTSYYEDGDYPVVKLLRDPVYLEVRILHRTDPNLVLILNDCWATPSQAAMQMPQWPILEERCPFTGDNYLTQLIPVASSTHYKRFSISTFTFVNERTQLSLGGLVYFHCSASVCVPSASDSCIARCAKRKRRQTEETATGEPVRKIITSNGPVYFIHAEKELEMEHDLLLPGTMAENLATENVTRNLITSDALLDFIDARKEKVITEGETTSGPVLQWLRGAAAVGGVLAFVLAVMGLRRCHRNRQNTVNLE